MIVLILLLTVLVAISAGWRAWRRLRYFLHIFQLEGYKPPEFFNWVKTRGRPMLIKPSHAAGFVLIWLGVILAAWTDANWWLVPLLLVWLVAFASAVAYDRHPPKKPLAFTPRMKRLIAAASVLGLLPMAAGLVLFVAAPPPYAVMAFLIGLWLFDAGVPLWVTLGSLVMAPVERRIQEGFKRRARRKLESRPDLTVIGITGSYGKTSVKFILKEILSVRYNVLATPGSYNTPMGVCLVVNNQLRAEHQALIVEMGARYTGDIAELCALARPDIAVVTSVGKAHLETMGPVENIARVKAEIIRGLKPGGVAVLNADDERVAKMADEAPGRVWRVSVGGEADVTASEIRYGQDGATFIIRDEEGRSETVQTRLLGRHNILNILLGVAVGRQMGLRLRQMKHSIASIPPVEHRLEMKRDGEVVIIDDAFNANPVGARNAVEILGQFNTGRRIIVTPGMVELGEAQDAENEALGSFMAPHIDLAVLIGDRQTAPIRHGLKSAGFPDERIRVFASLFESQDFLSSYLRPGDVVLYENDLPDQYNE